MIRFAFDMPLWLMGFYGGIMVLIVLALRFLLGRWLPKRVMPVLWALVLVRLLVPFSISSPLSLPVPSFLNNMGYFLEETATITSPDITFFSFTPSGHAITSSIPIEDPGIQVEDEEIEEKVASIVSVVETANTITMNQALSSGSWNNIFAELGYGLSSGLVRFWFAGGILLALILVWRYVRGRNHFRGLYPVDESILVRDTLVKCQVNASVYTCDTIQSPAVVGVIRPLILLPASLDFRETELMRHILTHEAMHIRRRDNLIKLIMMAALCLHWYNPLVWLMARELCRDMESACDESALALLGQEESAPYAQSLLTMAVPGLSGGLFASAFSRTEVERRIKGVLAYQKLGAFTLVAAMVVVLTSATAFATCGQSFFNDYLGDWCYSGSTYIARAALNRPIDLGNSRNYARSRANAVVMEALAHSASDDTRASALEKEIQKQLGLEFHVEPGAFKVIVAPALNPEETAAQYKEHGLEKDETNRWMINEKPVHVLEDEMAGVYYSNADGEVDVYIIRDEQYKLLRVESYLYYRF